MKMIFESKVYADIKNSVGRLPVETGGILLGSRDDYKVRKFYFDDYGSHSPGGYDPDVNYLNRIVKREWETNELALLGFVHSHPRGVNRLSGDWGNGIGDLGYLKRIFEYMPKLRKFLVPIIFSEADGGNFHIFPFCAERGQEENYQKADGIEIFEDRLRKTDKKLITEQDSDKKLVISKHRAEAKSNVETKTDEDYCKYGKMIVRRYLQQEEIKMNKTGKM